MRAMKKISSFNEIADLRGRYIFSLSGPLDAFIEEAISYDSNIYVLEEDNQQVGYFCVNSKQVLLQFYIIEDYIHQIKEIFAYLLTEEFFTRALVSTRDRLAVSVALEFQKNVRVDDYLFEDSHKPDSEYDWLRTKFAGTTFRMATLEDVPAIRSVNGDFHDFLHYTLEGSIVEKQIFVLYRDDVLLSSGVIATANCHPPYADIGMCVNEEYRRQHVGTYTLIKLKEYCYNNGLIPLASCNYKNQASKNTLEKAGFISRDRVLVIGF